MSNLEYDFKSQNTLQSRNSRLSFLEEIFQRPLDETRDPRIVYHQPFLTQANRKPADSANAPLSHNRIEIVPSI